MILIVIIQICSACQTEDLQICLTEIGDDFSNIPISGQNGVAYGFWSQYSSMSPFYERNFPLYADYDYQGYTLMREVEPLTDKVSILYYQKWIFGDTNPNKYLILQNDDYITEFQFESYSYEGRWIYHYFGFLFPKTLQVIIYDFDNCIVKNVNYLRSYQETIKINQGGQFKFEDISLGYFLGRLSSLDIQEQPLSFSSEQQFLQYLDSLNHPIPFCTANVYSTTTAENYQYQKGLILLESWIKIDYVSTLNATVSVFGIDITVHQKYQLNVKLIDLVYCLFQDTGKTWNGVIFQGLPQTSIDYEFSLDQFHFASEYYVFYHKIIASLKEWHFVQIYYGLDGDQPVQSLKMWFSEGSTYEKDLSLKIYNFYQWNIGIRTGFLFSVAQDGVVVHTGLSKIYVCQSTMSEFMKQCSNGCKDCDGPLSTDCLSCDQTSNRYYNNRQCKCNLGYIEDNFGKCVSNCSLLQQVFINLYPNSQQLYVPANQNLHQYGWFPIVYQDTTYLLECPKYNFQSDKILCIECLSNPETFAQNLICKTDYWLNNYGQYEIHKREQKDTELYLIDYELMQITLCQGCSQLCDPNIDVNCFKRNSSEKYFTCLNGYFSQNGECQQCADACSKCENTLNCLECLDETLILNPINGICTSCNQNCLKCAFDESYQLICVQCEEKFSLYQAQCMPCGKNCRACLYIFDLQTNSHYNRCIQCLDNKLYYLLFNAEDCEVNVISNCQYVIQFHKSWYLRMYDNTMLHLFSRRNYSQSIIFTYCALCDEGFAATILGQCIAISDLFPTTCTMMYQIENWQQYQYQYYTYYCQMYSEKYSDEVTSISNGCWIFLKNCITCYKIMCLECFDGYYVDIITGECAQCPIESQCLNCVQQSKTFKNGWKIWYRMFYALIKQGSFYNDVFGNEGEDQLEVVCTQCDPGLQLHNGKCILSCALNCKTCIIVDDQNYCVECNSYIGKPLSLFEGQCIECPRYCSLCHPKTSQQLSAINPYFSNSKIISLTHTCLLLENNLNKEEFIYNSNFKQFFKYNAITNDPNKVVLEFKLYCDLDLFEHDLKQSLNEQLFLSQNVKLNEILSSNNQQSNFNRIENQNLYEFFGSQQIQQVELIFSLLQDCRVSQNSFLFTTLTQNIYFLNNAAITLQGNQHKLILEQNLEILGFDQISFDNINIIIAGTDTLLNLQSLNNLDIILAEVTILSPIKSNFQLILINIKSLTIQGLSLTNVHFQNIDSFFKLQSQKEKIDVSLTQINIIDSIFLTTNLFRFNNENEQISIEFNNITISNSNFTNSTIVTSLYEISLSVSISDMTIKQSLFVDSYPIFMTYFLKTFPLQRVLMFESTLQNSTLFQINSETNCQDVNIINSFIFNSSIFSQNTNSGQPKNLNFYNLFFSNIIYDYQFSLMYISSKLSDSKITIRNISLINLQLSQNIVLDTNSVFPLLLLEAGFITLQQIAIIRLKGMTEFSLSQATKLIIQDVTIENGNLFPSLIANPQCETDIHFYQYLTVFHIERSQFIQLQNISAFNLIIFNAPLISISSIETQTVRRSELILIDTLIVSDCIIQKTQSANLIAMLYIFSDQQVQINFQNSGFTNNFYHSQEIESESDSALIMNLVVENSEVVITNCHFNQNYISQSQNSLMKLIAHTITISGTYFNQNNYFTSILLKHISWGFIQNKLTLRQLSEYFTLISHSGNGRLQTNNLLIVNSTIIEGRATQAGCFIITLQNEGIFQLIDSSFSQISSSTKGGCFYIEDKAKSINIMVMNTLFDSISSISEGGSIYFQPTSQNILLNFTNITIINSYSLIGAFINLKFSVYDTQIIEMNDCKISQTPDGFAKFVSSLDNIDKVQQSQLKLGTSVIVVKQGALIFKNIVIQLFITGFLETTYSNRVRLTSVIFDHSFYGNRPTIMISCSQDIECNVDIRNLQLLGYQNYKIITNDRISKEFNQQLILQSQCNSSITLINPFVEQVFVDLSKFGNENISSLLLISAVKASDQIYLKNSQIFENQCSGCQFGIIELQFSESVSNSANCQIQQLTIVDNQCGISGCLSFILESNKVRRILSETQNQIMINQLVCNQNKAVYGACIFSEGIGLTISNSVINGNSAVKLGGGLYYSGAVENLILYENLITSNTAASGGALYIDSNSSPELNRTKNYMSSQSNLISSYPSSLTLTLDNYKTIFQNYRTSQYMGYISYKANSQTQEIINLPSGQSISTYEYFDLTNQEYHPLNLTLRIVALNDFNERQKNLTSSICTISSGYQSSEIIILTNKQTNYNSKIFDNETLDYNFDDLILYKNDATGYILLFFECNSVKIPIYDEIFPYQITNYIQNYTLQLTIQLNECQLGEYENITDSSCHLCDVEKKQYSVQQGAISCLYMNEDTTISITPAQLQLKIGYWRPFINNGIIERCKNKEDNCLGGWKQGDETCLQGQLGACCESCDYYNVRGEGHFSKKELYKCSQCQDQLKQILYIIAVSLWILISINLTTKGVENMIQELQKNKVGRRQLIINSNKQTGPLMKMFTNYLQNIAIILNFNIDIPNALKEYFMFFGNSQQVLLISTDCFLAQSIQQNIIYLKILQCLINPLIYGLTYVLLYMIMVYFNKIYYNKVVITTSMLYLFCYFQPQAIQLLISTISYQTLSGIKWVQANLAYQFNESQHQQLIPYLIALTILLGVVVPVSLLIKIYFHKRRLYVNHMRQNWGYLFLEYQPKAYYWEFVRIFTRQFMILAITFYQDNIILKCVLVFVIIMWYSEFNNCVQPFQTSKLNQLETRNSVISILTILCIFTLTATSTLNNIILSLIFISNGHLFISFIESLLSSYLQAYEQSLDKIKDAIRSKFSNLIKKYPTFNNYLQNKEERRKLIQSRFKSIKKYLFQVTSIMSSEVKFSKLQSFKQRRKNNQGVIVPTILFYENNPTVGQRLAFLESE